MRILLIALWSFLIMSTAAKAQDNILVMETTKGDVVIQTMPDVGHCNRLQRLIAAITAIHKKK